ncbi:hypothetical protein F4777DRAFT_384632 [Nemania sp. FL0916]|nr:hypothetical protein F4777DRAFT_384632 [Nemania sp. FL0916]
MPIKKERRPVFERLRRNYNIVFIDNLPLRDWPANHRTVFESIDKLKQFKYSTYLTPQDDLEATPWKGEAKIQARKLAERVQDCLSRNEATWRLACEPLVFSRLTSEVACKNCRQRVWRSEVEAKLDGDNNAASNLRQRQGNRDRCHCPRSSRPDDEDERVGLNKLFIDRADDKVMHPEPLVDELPQEQMPDRIYGLRQTRNFEDLLLTKMGDGRFLEKHLHKPPHLDSEGEPMLFPFLVVEAKAGNALDDWTSVRLQTAFPIYTYLNNQQSLKSATGQKSRWTAGPLVWFFMSRGEDWRLSLAYQDQSTDSRSSTTALSTKIVQVWAGSITNRDDALQLFLIVDYMSDWARDIYRPALLRELRTLVPSNAQSQTVFTDTDIYSSRNILPAIPQAEEPEELASNNDVQAAFRSLDSRFGVVRHISPIKSRFLSIFITRDNIQTFVLSLKMKDRTTLLRKILKQLASNTPQPNLLSVDELNNIEVLWTGQSRLRGSYQLRDTRFYTVHLVVYYLSPSWEQNRDLCMISVAQDAFDALVAASELAPGRGKARPPAIRINEESNRWFINGLTQVRGASAQRNLLATVKRVARYVDGTVDPSQGECWFNTSDPFIWELVNNIYAYQKKGDLEPEQPYLHLSTSLEIQTVDTEDQDAFRFSFPSRATADMIVSDDYSDDGIEDITDHPLNGHLKVSNTGGVLLFGKGNGSRGERNMSNICVYIVRPSTQLPSKDEVAHIIKTTFEDCDVYHTTWDNGSLNLKADSSERKIWNIRKSLGVYFSYGGLSFVKWLHAWNRPLPERQGSPRGATDLGNIIFCRTYTPWHDPRYAYGGFAAEMKKKFVKELFRKEVTAWTHISRVKSSQGTACCVLCSRDGNWITEDDRERRHYRTYYGFISGLCNNCQEDLDITIESGWPLWMKLVLRRALKKEISTTPSNEMQDSVSSIAYIVGTPPSSRKIFPFLESAQENESSDGDSEDALVLDFESGGRVRPSFPDLSDSESDESPYTSREEDAIEIELYQRALQPPVDDEERESALYQPEIRPPARKRKRQEANEGEDTDTDPSNGLY